MSFRYLMTLFIFTIIMSPTLTDATECPSGFTQLHNGCYYFSTTAGTWSEASKTCRVMGAQLVSIETAEESLAINNHILYEYTSDTAISFWTSGSDLYTEGRFMWMGSQKNFTHTLWCGGQPDNSHGEHCVELVKNRGYKTCWNDKKCNSRAGADTTPMYFLCECGIKPKR